MRVSVVSENKQLETYLRGYESLTLVHFYSNLLTEYDKFNNDLNKVDVFAIVEHGDLSGDMTAISKLVQSGSSYLLGTKEVLLVLNGSTERTLNRTDKVNAFTDILTEKGYEVRTVIPTVLDFTSIYNAFIKNTVTQESEIKVYTKYKVSKDDKGIVLKPKKTKEKFSPDAKTGNKKALKKIDENTAKMLGNQPLDVEKRKDPIDRVVDNIVELPNLASLTRKVIFITGVTDVGKTHSMLTFAEDLSKNNILSLVVDSTGSDDMLYISQGNHFKTPLLKGSDIFNTKEQFTVGVQLYRKAYSSTFIHQLDNLSRNKNLVFCEVGLEQLETFLATWDGDTEIIVVVSFNVTALLELKSKLKPNVSYKVYVNNDDEEVAVEEVNLLKQFLGNNIQVYNYMSRLDLFNSLGGS